jgi:hypothetical protein
MGSALANGIDTQHEGTIHSSTLFKTQECVALRHVEQKTRRYSGPVAMKKPYTYHGQS